MTGTIFNRPGLNAMVEEVKAGNVATVIIKDHQSRIGRDVVEVGLWYVREHEKEFVQKVREASMIQQEFAV